MNPFFNLLVEALLTCDTNDESAKLQLVELLCVPEGDVNFDQSKTTSDLNGKSQTDSFNCVLRVSSEECYRYLVLVGHFVKIFPL